MKNYIILSIITISIASCTTDEEERLIDKLVIEPMTANAVDFANLAHGQESVYEAYSYSCDDMEEINIQDFVIYLGVVNKNDKWYFTESRLVEGDKIIDTEYEVIPSENMLRIPERSSSSLMYFYDSDKIDLAPAELLEIEQTDCVFSDGAETFDGEAIGFTNNFDFRGLAYNGKLALSCIPVILEGDAYLIHDTRQLIMSHRIESSEFGGVVSTYVSGFRLKK